MPTEQILHNCAETNRDGIGFAFNIPGDKVIIVKGFVNVKKLLRMLATFNIGKEHNLLIHFRLATHGQKDAGNCHPFPLTNNFEDMRKLHGVCDVAITHNGVFGGMKASDKYSDTMKFVGGILASQEIVSNLESRSVVELIRGYCGFSSKLAFLRPEGIFTIGEFHTDKDIMYSNKQYERWGYNSNDYLSTKYCDVHKEWDRCHYKEQPTFCHVHKKKDYCSYCSDHKILDECDYKKRNPEYCGSCEDAVMTVQKYLDLRQAECEWCASKEGVTYDVDAGGLLCEGCSTLYFNTERPIITVTGE